MNLFFKKNLFQCIYPLKSRLMIVEELVITLTTRISGYVLQNKLYINIVTWLNAHYS